MAFAHRIVALIALVGVAGCATGETGKDVQRTTEGPTAEEVFTSRFLNGYGRLPTFDESIAFRVDLEQQVSVYLDKHPELSTSPRASRFTFRPQVAIGMSKEEVALLAGAPDQETRDEAQMEAGAGQFWTAVKARADEMWVYPGGWQLYFEGDRLVDLTVIGKPPL